VRRRIHISENSVRNVIRRSLVSCFICLFIFFLTQKSLRYFVCPGTRSQIWWKFVNRF